MRLKMIPSWIIKWHRAMTVPPSVMELRSELRLLGDVLAIVDKVMIPFYILRIGSKELIYGFVAVLLFQRLAERSRLTTEYCVII